MHGVCMISTFLGKGSLFIMFWKGEGSKQRSFNIYHQEIGTKGNEKSTYIGNSYQNNYQNLKGNKQVIKIKTLWQKISDRNKQQ